MATIILLLVVAVLALDFFGQIKWGFYGYLTMNIVLFVKTRPSSDPQFFWVMETANS